MLSWYLVLELAASMVLPLTESPTLMGPMAEAQCEQARSSLGPLPAVVSARCRKAVGMMTKTTNNATAYAVPIFEGDLSVSVSSPR